MRLPKLEYRLHALWNDPRTEKRQLSEWLVWECGEVFLRAGRTYTGHHFEKCLVIANIDFPSTHRRQGAFTRLESYLMREIPAPLIVENVLDDAFLAALLRHGYHDLERFLIRELPISVIKRPSLVKNSAAQTR